MVSGKGVLTLAVALGLATSFGVWYYVDHATAHAKPLRMAPVVVAAGHVPPRTVLTREHLRVAELPQEARLPDAVTDPDAVVGKITKIALTSREQVVTSKLFAERKESGLAFVVPPGQRAVAVAVSEVIGSGGMIVPGDRVDVIGLVEVRRSIGAEAANVPIATTIVQNVEVLAVAQLLEGDEPPLSTTSRIGKAAGAAAGFGVSSATTDRNAPAKVSPAPQPQAKSVTLAVTPEDAQKIALGEQFGHLRLSLRPYGDNEIVPIRTSLLPGLDLSQLVPPPPQPTPVQGAGPRN